MSYRLYNRVASAGFAIEAVLTLAEIPFELVEIESRAGTPLPESFRQINPWCQVPTLVLPSGETLTEPTAVMQFGCWNAYYVAPRANTLAHQWLVDGDHGTALVMGSSTLAEAGSEQAFANRIMEGLAAGCSYGDAVRDAKLKMIRAYGLDSVRDLINGFVILGDPAMRPPLEGPDSQ